MLVDYDRWRAGVGIVGRLVEFGSRRAEVGEVFV